MEIDKKKLSEELLATAESIGKKIAEVAGARNQLIGFRENIEKSRISFNKEANEMTDESGKKKLSNEALREGYVKDKISTIEEYRQAKTLEAEIVTKEAEVEAMRYKFHAIKAVLIVISGNAREEVF